MHYAVSTKHRGQLSVILINQLYPESSIYNKSCVRKPMKIKLSLLTGSSPKVF